MRQTVIALAAALCLSAGAGHAGSCEDNGVTQLSFVVPFKAGGGYDLYARTLASSIEELGNVRVKVSNVMSGAGSAAVSLIAGSSDRQPRIGIFNSRNLLPLLTDDDGSGIRSSDLRFLGTVHAEGLVMVTRQEFELPPEGGSYVTAGSALEALVVNILIPRDALGMRPQVVTGYSGSTEQSAALLRGEVDADVMTLGSANKAVRSGDMKMLLSMSDGAEPSLPSVPYLLGAGSLFETRTAEWDDDRKAKAETDIRAVLALMHTYRLLATGNTMSDGVNACLEELVETALFSEEFAEQAEAAGRVISPLGATKTRDGLNAAFAAYAANRDLITSIVARESN